MKNFLFLLMAVSLLACEDSAKTSDKGRLGDAGNTFGSSNNSDSRLRIEDAYIEPDIYIRLIDARPIVDAVIDAAPPPIVCERYGLRESCDLPAFLGPCAQGERICHSTSWTQCTQVNFPRMEVCDDIDNDCDGNVNESPQQLGGGAQSPILFRSCYEGRQGSSKNGVCRPGISVCQQLARETDAGIEFFYGYGECENQVLPTEEECDSLDNDCDNSTDEGVLNICQQCGPDPVEVCDGIDNDCDEGVDENLLNSCGECGVDPIEECDGIDNDCDGATDELLLNACGACGDVPRELCDFVDNDCDGAIDEDFEPGSCDCEHPDYVPQPEVCNGVDEDCDGFVDEGPGGGPLTMLCSTDIPTGEVILYERREDGPQYVAGDCRLGAAFCESRRDENGALEYGFFECLQEVRPGIERCNEEDDDCDGDIDEDFEQGMVAVMMVIDVSGSMQQGELWAAFDATRNTVERLFNDGVADVCYMLAVVGNDDMFDPYLYAPADNCVPGVEDPPVVPVEDMRAAIDGLRGAINAGIVNRGGGTENTLDAIGMFLTDDLIDWDNDGNPDEVLWSTNRPDAQLRGIEDSWTVDLSRYNHRIVVVLGDERAQGVNFDAFAVQHAMFMAGGMVFIIGPDNIFVRQSYDPLYDAGGQYRNARVGGPPGQNEQEVQDAVVEAIEEAACIQGRQQRDNPDAGVEDAGVQDAGVPDAALPNDVGVDAGADSGMACYEPKKKETFLCEGFYTVAMNWHHMRMCF
tara:strand:- start:980 stop:3223 length:2244 start_codon:yes stop_codon:yes gene_type:complete